MCHMWSGWNFNPLRPRGRRHQRDGWLETTKYFNPLRPRGRRPGLFCLLYLVLSISTHSAREDGDDLKTTNLLPPRNFNPLRPRGRRPCIIPKTISVDIFQPTPPARTETAILHKKTNNSSSHFHNQITSYSLKSPPTCPAHIQNRSHCAVFPVRIPP